MGFYIHPTDRLRMAQDYMRKWSDPVHMHKKKQRHRCFNLVKRMRGTGAPKLINFIKRRGSRTPLVIWPMILEMRETGLIRINLRPGIHVDRDAAEKFFLFHQLEPMSAYDNSAVMVGVIRTRQMFEHVKATLFDNYRPGALDPRCTYIYEEGEDDINRGLGDGSRSFIRTTHPWLKYHR